MAEQWPLTQEHTTRGQYSNIDSFVPWHFILWWITCKHDVIECLSTAIIMGCHCKDRNQTKRIKILKNQCNWELFNTSMINLDTSTVYKQGKCMNVNPNNGFFPFYLGVWPYSTVRLHSAPFKGYCLMKAPWPIPWAGCLCPPPMTALLGLQA